MATTLVVPWAELLPSSEPANPLVPSIELLLIGREGRTWKANFLVDSGADISLAPRALCERLGLVGDAGQPMLLNGISERPDGAVPARHDEHPRLHSDSQNTQERRVLST